MWKVEGCSYNYVDCDHVHVMFVQYLAPARPNNIPIHNISVEMTRTNESEELNYTYLLTIIPATCQVSIPLITIALERENSPGSERSLAMVYTINGISCAV